MPAQPLRPSQAVHSEAALTLFDARPYFEKVLCYAVQHGLLTPDKLATMAQQAPTGMVQIARYFGSEYLRPELEAAQRRIVNLVSLYLYDSTQGDLPKAARLLASQSFLSCSKAGSALLKALIMMPQSSHFGMHECGVYGDRHKPLLARWSLASLAEYQSERAARQSVAQVVDAALWLAEQRGLAAPALCEFEPDAEAVIRTALLLQLTRQRHWPDWPNFEKMLLALRQRGLARVAPALQCPARLPAEFQGVVQGVLQSLRQDLPRLLDAGVPARQLLDHTPAFMGRYFWLEDSLSLVLAHDDARARAWDKLTQGQADESTLLTLFVSVASGAAATPLWSEKSATALLRKLRKTGLQSHLVEQFIASHAPFDQQDDYLALWHSFYSEAQATLLSDWDRQLTQALALLRRECNVR